LARTICRKERRAWKLRKSFIGESFHGISPENARQITTLARFLPPVLERFPLRVAISNCVADNWSAKMQKFVKRSSGMISNR
jgi:hypothetical protein